MVNPRRVIQRWNYLITHTSLNSTAAYDLARKELYRVRHASEIETRVAREEARAMGAYFTLSPLDIGDKLEDEAYENWKEWAIKESQALRALQSAAYSGTEDTSAETDDAPSAGLDELASSVPASKAGLSARGGSAVTV
jgi:small subunit ribosomal protein S23